MLKRCQKVLTSKEQQLVLESLDRVHAVAYTVWREAHLPAMYIEDMKAEAALYACISALRYKEGLGWSFVDLVAWQVRRYLWRWVWKVRGILKEVPPTPLDQFMSVCIDNAAEDGQLVEEEGEPLLLKLVDTLPTQQRRVIELRYGLTGGGEMSTTETAKKLGIAKPTAHQYAHKGLENLRNRLRGGLSSDPVNIHDVRKLLKGELLNAI